MKWHHGVEKQGCSGVLSREQFGIRKITRWFKPQQLHLLQCDKIWDAALRRVTQSVSLLCCLIVRPEFLFSRRMTACEKLMSTIPLYCRGLIQQQILKYKEQLIISPVWPAVPLNFNFVTKITS